MISDMHKSLTIVSLNELIECFIFLIFLEKSSNEFDAFDEMSLNFLFGRVPEL
jgi:hypothetical protein